MERESSSQLTELDGAEIEAFEFPQVGITRVRKCCSGWADVSAIECSWKAADVNCPSHRTLEGFASGLRKSGELPQRSGSVRK